MPYLFWDDLIPAVGVTTASGRPLDEVAGIVVSLVRNLHVVAKLDVVGDGE